jgi:CheY-like chemotaxis protein
LAGIRAVVVEDHPDMRDLLVQVLEHLGASVLPAETAREGAQLVDDADIVVTDYSMPGDTGVWLLERVRERSRPVPVILVTGYADIYADAINRAPFSAVLRKPINLWQLGQIIHGLVGPEGQQP